MRDFLRKNRPDVVWTYGSDAVSLAVQQLVKRLDIPIVFGLHNLNYQDVEAFRMADYVVVPSEFCRQHYWETLGLGVPSAAAGDRSGKGGRRTMPGTSSTRSA